MSINIFYRDSHLQGRVSGPLKVIHNLLRSLDDCEVEYAINEDRFDNTLFLHWDQPQIDAYQTLRNKDKLLVGPQIWPFESKFNLLTEYRRVLVPSQWCVDSYDKSFPDVKTAIWPVAIYKPEITNNITTDCLIYHKNRSQQDLEYVKTMLSRRRLSYTQLQYGGYTQQNFRDALSSVRFCVIIDNTESQGIAIQEMMYANKPLFVWDQTVWDHMGEQYKVDATSVPYWNPMCGEVVRDSSRLDQYLDIFLQALEFYTPAKYVEKNLSAKPTVKILMDLFNEN